MDRRGTRPSPWGAWLYWEGFNLKGGGHHWKALRKKWHLFEPSVFLYFYNSQACISFGFLKLCKIHTRWNLYFNNVNFILTILTILIVYSVAVSISQCCTTISNIHFQKILSAPARNSVPIKQFLPLPPTTCVSQWKLPWKIRRNEDIAPQCTLLQRTLGFVLFLKEKCQWHSTF